MPRKLNHYIFLLVAMGSAFLLSSYLLNSLFLEGDPTPSWEAFKQNTSSVANNTLAYIDSVTESLTSATPTPSPAPTIEPSLPPEPTTPQPTATLPPTPTTYNLQPTTPPPTPLILPTTNYQLLATKTPSRIPTKYISPTRIPTTYKPQPTTPPPLPTDKPNPLQIQGDPLKQPWYGSKSMACYTTDRLIEVYAGGVTPDKCYNNVKARLDITSTTLLGRSIQIHRKTVPAFQAVEKVFNKYKAGKDLYKFPSKTYKIKNVGGYIFRCNVNASTSGKFDTCDPGCKLSPHSFGIAVDINYDENCNGCKTYDMPKEIWSTMEQYGFRWGGHYPLLGSTIDPMHFEYMRDLCEGI
jgi:hypothetical protein